MASPALSTIGYQGSTIDRLTDRLRAAGVRLLLDVRAVPLSRKPGFSKRQLAASLDEAGIAYVHLRALGTPKPGRIAARAGRTEEMHRIFAAHMQGAEATEALAEATSLARRAPTCLLCFEADHRACHRAVLADSIAAATFQPIDHLWCDPVDPNTARAPMIVAPGR